MNKDFLDLLLENAVKVNKNRKIYSKKSRFHRQGDKKEIVPESLVLWTPAFQSFESCGDESEPYCSTCDNELDMNWDYCPNCGAKLFQIITDSEGNEHKEFGLYY